MSKEQELKFKDSVYCEGWNDHKDSVESKIRTIEKLLLNEFWELYNLKFWKIKRRITLKRRIGYLKEMLFEELRKDKN